MDRTKYFVYMHRRASDGLPFYIGKGCKYRDRDKTGRNKWWHRTVQKHGYKIEILHFDLDDDTAKVLEVVEINNKRQFGYPMVNLTNGGDGCSGMVFSDESRAKISVANTGKSPSPETRRKMSESQTGRKHSQKTKDKISNANKTRSPKFNAEVGIKRRNQQIHGFLNLNDGSFETMRQQEIIRAFNLNPSKVSEIISGTRPQHKGFIHSKWCGCKDDT